MRTRFWILVLSLLALGGVHRAGGAVSDPVDLAEPVDPVLPKPVVRGGEAPTARPPQVLWETKAPLSSTWARHMAAPVVDGAGRVYVASRAARDNEGTFYEILRLDPRDRPLAPFATTGQVTRWIGKLPNYEMVRVVLAMDGTRDQIYATTNVTRQIAVLSLTGKMLGSIPLPTEVGDAYSYRNVPDLAVGAEGVVAVSQSGKGRVHLYDPRARTWTVFDREGERPGELKTATAVGFTPSGELLVADRDNRRVTRFDRPGRLAEGGFQPLRYRYEIRHRHAGSDIDATPLDIGTPSDGRTIVLYGRCAAEYEASGRLRWHWDAPGHLPLHSAELGTAPDGTMYLTVSSFRPEVVRLVKVGYGSPAPAGARLAVRETIRVPGGAGRGQFNRPCGVAADDQGNVYVTDFHNHRVQKFDRGGSFLRQFGFTQHLGQNAWQYADTDPPSGFRKMKWPAGVAVDAPRRKVYVAGWGLGTLLVFTPEGEWLGNFGAGFRPWGLAVTQDGKLVATAPRDRNIRVFGPDEKQEAVLGEAEGLKLRVPGMVAARGSQIYVVDREAGEVVVYDLEARREVRRFGSGALNQPDGIAVGPDGQCWVADTSNHRLAHFDSAGKLLGAVGAEGQEAGRLRWPKGVALTDAGLVVSDWGNDRVQWLDGNTGEARAVVGSFSTQNDNWHYGAATALPLEDGLFLGTAWLRGEETLATFGHRRARGDDDQVAMRFGYSTIRDGLWRGKEFLGLTSRQDDAFRQSTRLETYDHAGTLIRDAILPLVDPRSVTGREVGRPQMTLGKAGLYVTDPDFGDILWCNLDGKVRKRFGRGRVSRPTGIGVGRDGDVYVADAALHRVAVFSPEGRYRRTWGRFGFLPGDLAFPATLACGTDGTLAIWDAGSGRVKQFTLGGQLVATSAPFNLTGMPRVSAGRAGSYYLTQWDTIRELAVTKSGSRSPR